DDAVKRIEHPQPSYRRQRHWHRPRQHDERAGDATAAELLHQQHSADLAEQEADDLRTDGEHQSIDERAPKDLAVDDIAEVLQPDEREARIEDAVGADAVIKRKQERQADQHQHVEDRWRDEQRPDHLRPIQQEAGPHWARGSRDRRHRSRPLVSVRRPSRSTKRSSVSRTANWCHAPGEMPSSVACAGSFAVTSRFATLPSSAPYRLCSEPRYSTRSMRNGSSTTGAPLSNSLGRKFSGRNPIDPPSRSMRFIGGVPKKMATNSFTRAS